MLVVEVANPVLDTAWLEYD